MNAGKPLYIEGVDIGYSLHKTDFYKMLGATYIAEGSQFITIRSMTGQSGSIVDGKTYNFYSDFQDMSKANDEIEADKGTLLFKSNLGIGQGVSYEGTQDNYRLIYTSFVFSAIRGVDDRNELMKIYLDYLLPASPVIENNPGPATVGAFTIAPIIQNNMLEFTLHKATRISVGMFTVTGRLVQNVIRGNYNKGTYIINLNQDGKTGSGNYVLRFNANGETKNRIIKKTK